MVIILIFAIYYLRKLTVIVYFMMIIKEIRYSDITLHLNYEVLYSIHAVRRSIIFFYLFLSLVTGKKDKFFYNNYHLSLLLLQVTYESSKWVAIKRKIKSVQEFFRKNRV